MKTIRYLPEINNNVVYCILLMILGVVIVWKLENITIENKIWTSFDELNWTLLLKKLYVFFSGWEKRFNRHHGSNSGEQGK